VGEVRLPKEAFYTLQALHTGHDGSATTVHASSAEDALFRIELLARQSMHDLSLADLRAYIARVFDVVVVLRRQRSGLRIVRQLAALDGSGATASTRSRNSSKPGSGLTAPRHGFATKPGSPRRG